MSIEQLVKYVFSYVEFYANDGFFERFLNLCAFHSVRVVSPKIKDGVFTAKMSVKDYKNILPLARKAKIKLKISSKKGLYFTLKKHHKRSGLAVGAVLFFVIVYALSGFVWNVNIVGSDDLPRDDIAEKLEQFGIFDGCRKSDLTAEKSKLIRNNLLNNVNSLSWASLNLDGCILNVECRQKAKVPSSPEYTPCNIIAKKGGKIISVKAYNGTPCVKSGLAVSAGQLLISGTVELTNGSTIFCHADGEVLAEVENKLEVFVPFEQTSKTTLTEPQTRSVVTFFGMNIPLFLGEVKGEYKSVGHILQPEFCDVRLPLSMTVAKFYPLTVAKYEIGVDEAKKRAVEKLAEMSKNQFGDDVIRGSIVDFTENKDGILAKCTYICKENIEIAEKILIN